MGGLLDLDVQREALREMVRRFAEGSISGRDLARWAHTHIGHDGPGDCEPFVLLDDIYDTVDYGAYDMADADVWTAAEANAFLAGLPSPGHTQVYHSAADVPSAPSRRRSLWLRRLSRRGRERQVVRRGSHAACWRTTQTA